MLTRHDPPDGEEIPRKNGAKNKVFITPPRALLGAVGEVRTRFEASGAFRVALRDRRLRRVWQPQTLRTWSVPLLVAYCCEQCAHFMHRTRAAFG